MRNLFTREPLYEQYIHKHYNLPIDVILRQRLIDLKISYPMNINKLNDPNFNDELITDHSILSPISNDNENNINHRELFIDVSNISNVSSEDLSHSSLSTPISNISIKKDSNNYNFDNINNNSIITLNEKILTIESILNTNLLNNEILNNIKNLKSKKLQLYLNKISNHLEILINNIYDCNSICNILNNNITNYKQNKENMKLLKKFENNILPQVKQFFYIFIDNLTYNDYLNNLLNHHNKKDLDIHNFLKIIQLYSNKFNVIVQDRCLNVKIFIRT